MACSGAPAVLPENNHLITSLLVPVLCNMHLEIWGIMPGQGKCYLKSRALDDFEQVSSFLYEGAPNASISMLRKCMKGMMHSSLR